MYLSNLSCNEIEEYKDKLIIEAKKLIGTPFRHNGRSSFGLDCAGLLYLTYRRAGIELPSGDGSTYQSNWFEFDKQDRFMNTLTKYFSPVDKPDRGDIVTFYCFNRSNKVTHSGIYWKNRAFFHARSRKNVESASLNSRYWGSKFAGYMRYKGFV